MASNIDSASINALYPVAGQDNDSQGFRDNFSNIKTSLTKAKTEAQSIISDAKSAAENLKEDIVSKARTEADSQIEKAKAQIIIEKDKAMQEIRSEVVNLSIDVAEKIISPSKGVWLGSIALAIPEWADVAIRFRSFLLKFKFCLLYTSPSPRD